jgi:hypothetical protein
MANTERITLIRKCASIEADSVAWKLTLSVPESITEKLKEACTEEIQNGRYLIYSYIARNIRSGGNEYFKIIFNCEFLETQKYEGIIDDNTLNGVLNFFSNLEQNLRVIRDATQTTIYDIQIIKKEE